MIFSQRDPKWKDVKLGNGKTTIGGFGCFVTSLAMLSGKTPPEVNEILKRGGYFQGDLIISSVKMAQSLGLEYHGRDNLVNYNPKYQTIAEVDMSPAPGKQQHFVVVNQDGSILDPWTGTQRPKGVYPLVSYRLFEKVIIQKPILSETPINDNPVKANDAIELTPDEAQNSPVLKENTEMGKDTIVEVKTSPEGKSEASNDTGLKFDWEKQAWVRDNNLILNNMKNIKKFFADKRVRTFGWNMLGSFLGIVALYLGELNPSYGVVLIPMILATTKWINKTYLS
jgi:hypothetical protein